MTSISPSRSTSSADVLSSRGPRPSSRSGRCAAGRCGPGGSSGAPHNGHGGLPAATMVAARATNERAADAVIRTRSRSGPSSSSSSSSSGSTASPSSSRARASINTRSALPSQPSVRDPALKASLTGSSSGSSSTAPWARASAADSLGRRDAAHVELVKQCAEALGQDRDCTFSSTTDTTRPPSRAWRKKVRSPGSPTCRRRIGPAGRRCSAVAACPDSIRGATRAGSADIDIDRVPASRPVGSRP